MLSAADGVLKGRWLKPAWLWRRPLPTVMSVLKQVGAARSLDHGVARAAAWPVSAIGVIVMFRKWMIVPL